MTIGPATGTRLLPPSPSHQQLLEDLGRHLLESVGTHPNDLEALSEATGGTGFCDVLPILAALDRLGYHDQVRGLLYRYGSRQHLNGELRLGTGGPEDTACALWSLVDHARLTGDLGYLKAVYRPVRRGMKRLRKMRGADGSDPHTGLIRPAGRLGRPSGGRPGRPSGGPSGEVSVGGAPYPLALLTLAGVQEATRASAALGRSLHRHEGETFYHELMLALQRSLRQTAERTGTPGLPSHPDLAVDREARGNLWALAPGDVLGPDDAHLGATLDRLAPGMKEMDLRSLAAFGQLTLRRGDPGVWSVVGALESRVVETLQTRVLEALDSRVEEGVVEAPDAPVDGPSIGLLSGAGQAAWLLRDMLLYDQHDLLMIAPAWALRPLEPGTSLKVERAPTRFGLISYRMECTDEGDLSISWGGTPRSVPKHILWPLPERAWTVEPAGALVTESRRAVRLPPEGGSFRVRLVG